MLASRSRIAAAIVAIKPRVSQGSYRCPMARLVQAAGMSSSHVSSACCMRRENKFSCLHAMVLYTAALWYGRVACVQMLSVALRQGLDFLHTHTLH